MNDTRIENIIKETIHHAGIGNSLLPFVIGQFLRFENYPKFQQWLTWERRVIPGKLDFAHKELTKYCD
jgi:hypothetical protein